MSPVAFSSADGAILSADSPEPGIASLSRQAELRHDRRTITSPPIALENSLVPSYEFSTLDVPREEQFPAWRASYAPIVDLIGPDDCSVDFTGQQVSWDLGSLVFSRVRTDGLDFTSLSGHIRRDPIDHWLISLLLRGCSTTTVPSRTLNGHAGSVQIHPLGKVFEGHLTDCEMLQLYVPRDFFRGMTHVLDGAEFTTRDDGMAGLFAEYMTSLANSLPLLDAADLPKVVTATRAMILACIAPSSEQLDQAGDAVANALFERARRFVADNTASPNLGVRTLQRALGVSRSRLYRLFEPHGGVSRYIQRRRLLEAHAALADPGDTRRILDVADEFGFTDASEFSRAFKREFGYSPGDVRTVCKEGPTRHAVAGGLDGLLPRDRLGALLHRLQA